MVRARRGAGSLGCLTMLLLLAAVVYFGLPIGEAYVRYYRFQDEMKQAARFASMRNDQTILAQLRSSVDSLGLPEEAKAIGIQRMAGDRIIIAADYQEEFQLPGTVRIQRFSPRVEATY